MSKLPQIDPATATGAAAELLAQVQKSLGVTPNMTKVMANSPALLKGYLALLGALDSGVIPAPVRERLAVATAEINGCEYCLSAHTYIGANVAHVDADELERARSAESTDPHTAALLTLSNAVLSARGSIDDVELDAARRAGVTDAEIGEVVGHIALNVLTNYFNILSQVDNDWPVVTLRVAAGPSRCSAHHGRHESPGWPANRRTGHPGAPSPRDDPATSTRANLPCSNTPSSAARRLSAAPNARSRQPQRRCGPLPGQPDPSSAGARSDQMGVPTSPPTRLTATAC